MKPWHDNCLRQTLKVIKTSRIQSITTNNLNTNIKSRKSLRLDGPFTERSSNLVTKVINDAAAVQDVITEDTKRCSSQGSGHKNHNDTQNVKSFRSIPGPRPLPFIGNKLFFTPIGGYPVERYWETCQRLYERYGPIVKIERFSGNLDMVVVFHPNDTRKMFQAEGQYPVRPGLDILTHYRSKRKDWFTSPGLVPGNGPEWRRLRSAIHPLLRREVLNSYRPAQTEVARDLVSAIASYAQRDNKKIDSSKYIIPDLLSILFHYTLEAVGVVSLGTRLGCLTTTTSSLMANTDAQSIIAANTEVLTVLGESIFLPPLYKLFPTKTFRRLTKAQDIISRMVEAQYSQRRWELATDPDGFSQKHPFLANLMTNPELSTQDIFILLVEIFQGGIDATATTLGFCVHFLAGHPEAQERLFEEVQHVHPETHSLQGLVYLRAVLQETLRLRPSASARSRVIQEQTVFSNYVVPRGTFVVSPPVVACHDPEVFEEPSAFRPDRWLQVKENTTSNGNGILSRQNEKNRRSGGKKIDPYTILAFGHGARMCPGRRLAEQEIYLALIELVKTYKMELRQEKNVGQVMRLNMMPDANFEVVFIPRIKTS